MLALHHREDSGDEGVRYSRMEQIRHGVDEHEPRPAPPPRDLQSLWPEPKVKALLVRVPGDATEPLSQGLGVAMLAPGRDLRAPSDRIPRGFGPLDRGAVSHDWDGSASFRRTSDANQQRRCGCATTLAFHCVSQDPPTLDMHTVGESRSRSALYAARAQLSRRGPRHPGDRARLRDPRLPSDVRGRGLTARSSSARLEGDLVVESRRPCGSGRRG